MKPRIWTSSYLHLSRLRKDFTPFLTGETKALLISCVPPQRSTLHHLLIGADIIVETAVCAIQDGNVRFVASEHFVSCDNASQALIIVDRALPSLGNMRSFKDEAQRVLKPGGRIVIYVNRSDHIDPTEPRLLVGQDAVAKWLAPEFRIYGQRTQGGLGSSLRVIVAGWSRRMLHSRPLLRRAMIILAFLLMPIWMLVALLASALSLALDKLDGTKAYYVSSITVADSPQPEKAGTA